MDPEASAREDPIRAHRIKTLGIIGLRHIAKIDILGADPTPIATPAEETEGILLAKCLKPRRIMEIMVPLMLISPIIPPIMPLILPIIALIAAILALILALMPLSSTIMPAIMPILTPKIDFWCYYWR